MRIVLALTIAATVFLLVSCSEDDVAGAVAPDKGTIKGNVSDVTNGPVDGAIVLLMDEGQLVAGETPLDNGSVTDSSGNYTVYLVEPDKNYYVAAIDDKDGNMEYTPGTDSIGYHGNLTDFTWIPTSVTVTAGQTLENINVTDLIIIPAK